MVKCAICGRQIRGSSGSIDHIFPRALCKWMKSSCSHSEYQVAKSIINSNLNRVQTHKKCNALKDDSIIPVNTLYLDSKIVEQLESMQNSLNPVIEKYKENKTNILTKQNGRCYNCGHRITGQGVLRRVDPAKKRTWGNACIVCHTCNINKADFL